MSVADLLAGVRSEPAQPESTDVVAESQAPDPAPVPLESKRTSRSTRARTLPTNQLDLFEHPTAS